MAQSLCYAGGGVGVGEEDGVGEGEGEGEGNQGGRLGRDCTGEGDREAGRDEVGEGDGETGPDGCPAGYSRVVGLSDGVPTLAGTSPGAAAEGLWPGWRWPGWLGAAGWPLAWRGSDAASGGRVV
jgi:hypothetical protein